MPSREVLDFKSVITAAQAVKDSTQTGAAFNIVYVDAGNLGSANLGTLADPFNNAATALQDAETACAVNVPSVVFIKRSDAAAGFGFLTTYTESIVSSKPIFWQAVGDVWWKPVDGSVTALAEDKICLHVNGATVGAWGVAGVTFWGGIAGSDYRKGRCIAVAVDEYFTTGSSEMYSKAGQMYLLQNIFFAITCLIYGSPSLGLVGTLTGGASKAWFVEENLFLLGSVSYLDPPDPLAVPPSPEIYNYTQSLYAGGLVIGGESLVQVRNNIFQVFNGDTAKDVPVKGNIEAFDAGLFTVDIDTTDVTIGTMADASIEMSIYFTGSGKTKGSWIITNVAGPVGTVYTLTLQPCRAKQAETLTGISATEGFVLGYRNNGIIRNYGQINLGGVYSEGFINGYLNPIDLTGNTIVLEQDGYVFDDFSILECSLSGNALWGTKLIEAKANIVSISGVNSIEDNLLSKASFGFDDVTDPDLQSSYTKADNAYVNLEPIRTIAETIEFAGVVNIDTKGSGTAGTDYPIGTATTPSDNIADAKIIADREGINEYMIRGSVTLLENMTDTLFVGFGALESQVLTGGFDVDGSTFDHIKIGGDCSSSLIDIQHCEIGNVTNLKCRAIDTTISDDVTMSGNCTFIHCASDALLSNVPIIDFNSVSAISLRLSGHSGALEVRGITNGSNTATCDFLSGALTLHSSNTLGTIDVRGAVYLTDNSVGSSVATKGITAREDDLIIVDTVVDAIKLKTDNLPSDPTSEANATTNKSEIIDEVDFNELKLDLIQSSQDIIDVNVTDILVDTDQMQGKLPTNNIMGSSVKTDKDDEIDAILVDTAAMQPTIATNLDVAVSTRAVAGDEMDLLSTTEDTVVDKVWDEVISNSAHNGAQSAGKRLRQAGTLVAEDGQVNGGTPAVSSFITDLTQATDDFYNDQTLVFVSGTLTGQARVITSYNGTTKIVTFDEPFTSAPVSTDEFSIFADHVHPVSQIVDGVWDEPLAGHTTAGTSGKAVTDVETDVTFIKGKSKNLIKPVT